MTLYTSTVAPSGGVNTLDLTGLLEHVRRERYFKPRHRDFDPHPVLVALIAVGGLLACTAFWGLIAVFIALKVL